MPLNVRVVLLSACVVANACLIAAPARAGQGKSEPPATPGKVAPEQPDADGRVGLASALREFFETAYLVDQSLLRAQLKTNDLRRQGVLMNVLPEIGFLTSQLRLMQMVRIYLRNQQRVDGVVIREVDRAVPEQELVQVLTPQDALYLNSFALDRLRALSDMSGFPAPLRTLLKSARLIHDPPPATEPGGGQSAGGPGSASAAGGAPPPTGKRASPFRATDMDGRTVDFPASYAGKVVLLDFWATWCPPCRDEVPALVSTYQKYRTRGFDILGVNLDRPNQSSSLKAFLAAQKMPWRQIYEGKGWETSIAVAYGVHSIPNPLLVDGSSGSILAEGDLLRGPYLDETVGKIMTDRGRRR
jgi:thiol-disulfide isomerase/thioredoxin